MFKKIGLGLAGLGALTWGSMVNAAVTIDTAEIKAAIDDGASSAGTIASYGIAALSILIVIGIIVAVVRKF